MAEALTWSHPVVVSELPPEGTDFELAPDEQVRASLARHTGVQAVPSLVATLQVRPNGHGGAAVEGRLDGTVRQTCVVTLEPFDNPVSESISLRFAPAQTVPDQAAGAAWPGEAEPPDPLIDGTLDLAAVVTEFLTLAIDPYPRRPGVEFKPPEAEAGRESPFAALARLKRRGKGAG